MLTPHGFRGPEGKLDELSPSLLHGTIDIENYCTVDPCLAVNSYLHEMLKGV